MNKRIILLGALVIAVVSMIGGFTMAWFTAKAEVPKNEFNAGTVMIEADTYGVIKSGYINTGEGIYLYGIARQSRQLYEINVLTGNVQAFYTIPLLGATDFPTSPNGLGLDANNDRLYFSVTKGSNSEIWFYDFGAGIHKFAGTAPGLIYGATYGEGYYWYIEHNTDNLYRIKFNSTDGTVVSGNDIAFRSNITAPNNKKFRLGDTDVDIGNGIIYVSTSGDNGTSKEFFKYDISTGVYTMITNNDNDAVNLQVAFGSNGQLYGHWNQGEKWYRVNKDTGAKSEIVVNTNVRFQDLASGHRKVWNPGDCDKLKYYVKNTGTKKSHVRISLTGYWQEYVDGEWKYWTTEKKVVSYNLCNDEWKVVDDKFYYKSILYANPPNDIAEFCVEVCLDGPETTNEFQGKRFMIEATFDAIQVTNNASVEHPDWGLDPTSL